MGVITKPSSVQRSGIVRLLGACGMAAGCGGDHPRRSPRGAVYRRHGLLPRAQHALLLTQTVHKKRVLFDELFHRKPLILDLWPVVSPLLLMARTRHHRITRPVGA